MIWDFPKIKYKTIDVQISDQYVHRKDVVVRKPWMRIIWKTSQKTIKFGRHTINFTYEPDIAEHLEDTKPTTAQDWWEK